MTGVVTAVDEGLEATGTIRSVVAGEDVAGDVDAETFDRGHLHDILTSCKRDGFGCMQTEHYSKYDEVAMETQDQGALVAGHQLPSRVTIAIQGLRASTLSKGSRGCIPSCDSSRNS